MFHSSLRVHFYPFYHIVHFGCSLDFEKYHCLWRCDCKVDDGYKAWESKFERNSDDKEASDHQAKSSIEELEKVNAKLKDQGIPFPEQHLQTIEEIQGLKEFFDKKEAYSGQLVIDYTRAMDNLQLSRDRVRSLESVLELFFQCF